MHWALIRSFTLVLLCAVAGSLQAATLDAATIVARAHAAAGGDTWVNPATLTMTGYGLFFSGAEVRKHDSHRMWRVYPTRKSSAHQADGKVRIDSKIGDRFVFQIAWDGTHTYTKDGIVEDAADSARWQANFGFGSIRFALTDGYRVERLPDDRVDGFATYTVKVIDPTGTATLFGIGKGDYRIRWLGFATPRGWHERRYSDFFSKPGIDWVQPGRVRLFYDGVKANEIIWTDFNINTALDDDLFVLPSEPD